MSGKTKNMIDNKINNTKSLKNKQNSPIYNSIKVNYLFWFSIVLSITSICYFTTGNSTSSYVSGIYTYIFIAFWGYLMHYISHSYNFTEMYKNSTNFKEINKIQRNQNSNNSLNFKETMKIQSMLIYFK